MADILQAFPIQATPDAVYQAISTPAGLDQWWTRTSAGVPEPGQTFRLSFGPGYDWEAVVTRAEPGVAFELTLTRADEEWRGTRVGFELDPADAGTQVRFHHCGWPEAGEHYRISCYCWAMYLRILKRFVEYGETVDYERRLEV